MGCIKSCLARLFDKVIYCWIERFMGASMDAVEKKVPVTIVTGALGSGKTTFVNRVLTSDHGLRIGVIVNEFGEVGIDSELIVRSEEKLVELSNGCVCCSVREDLVSTVKMLVEKERVNYILLETSGLSEVVPAAMAFEATELKDIAFIDSIICLVDAVHFLDALRKHRSVREQVEVADFVLLNKADLVHRSDLDRIKEVIRDIVPQAHIIETVRADVDVRLLLGVNKPHLVEDWKKSQHLHAHDGGISAVSAEAGAVDSDKVQEFLESLPDTVFRAKGILCIKESRPGEGDELRVSFQKVGRFVDLELTRPWLPSEEKKTKVVFIGKHLDSKAL
ncbi:GTP-binding protein, partial [Candidatus Woesearchaeota archaeon]